MPAGSTATSATDFYLSSGATGAKTYKNVISLNVITGETAVEKFGEGDIKLTGNIPVESGVITAYASVCPITLQNAIVQCTPNSDACARYVWRAAGASNPLSVDAGASYTMTRTAPKVAMSGSIWHDDSAIPEAGIDANETGNPYKSSKSTVLWGYEYNYSVLQIEAGDFAGTYAATSSTGSSDAIFVNAASSRNVVSLNDSNWSSKKNNGATNTFSLTYTGTEGSNLKAELFSGLSMSANVSIDYSKKKCSFNFQIKNSTTKMGSGFYKDEYLAYATELVKISNSTYQLGYANGGEFVYAADEVVLNGSDIAVSFNSWCHDKTYVSRVCTSYNTFYVVGILVNRFASASPVGANLIRSTNNNYSSDQGVGKGSAYAWCIQGAFTMKKASGSADAGSITADGYTEK